jgi:hypothetical protein
MARVLIILAVTMIGSSVFASVAEAAFVTRDTLRPGDVRKSVRDFVRDLTGGSLVVDGIEGIHHPRTIDEPSQANLATIYARVSGEVPSPIPRNPPIVFDEDLVTFGCEQLEDRRWICSALLLRSLIDPGSLILFRYFFLER